MGDAKKKWCVTYTKHLKQKRKVYQDGFLELQSSTHKVMLYDDCEKLLGIKILKNDIDVKEGETLAFDSYLVDIGDPHGDYKPVPILKTKQIKKESQESGLLHSGKGSTAADNRKSNLGKRKAFPSPLSPSHKIIREFKKSEAHKYNSSPGSLDMTKSSTEEWQVLYTTQMTQKAKKFHDGYLQLVMSSSHCRQIMLYDATRRLLDSRFLKKNESIMSGQLVTFDGHLVELGECEEGQKPPKQIIPQGKHTMELGKRGPIHDEVAVHNKLPAEWDVMYTTQITQKAKKYSNGILKLSSCGSYQSQVTLLTEDGIILCRRFLKLSEHVTTGATLNLPNYLVEVGDMRTSAEGKPQNDASSQEHAQSDIKISGLEKIKLSRRISFNKPIPNREPQNGPCSVEHVDSKTGSVDNTTSCSISKTDSVPAEWDVMYTTQVTQKAKKYINGILRLSSCGSYQSQVTLLTEDGIILCRTFLKLSEHVRTGTTLNLPNFLVEVGDMRTSPEGKPQNDVSSQEHALSDIKISALENIKLSRRTSFNKPIPNRKPQNVAISLEHVDSKSANIDNNTSCRISGTNSVRAAHEILSILKKPITSEGVVTVRSSTYADECQLLQSSGLVSSAIKRETEEHFMQYFNDKGSSPEHKVEETIMTHRNDRKISKMKATDAFHLDSISQPSDCADQRVSQTQSLSLSTGLAAADIWSCDVECALTERRSPTAKLKHLAIPESDSKVKAVEILCHDRSSKISEIKKASESVSHHQDNHSGSMAALTDFCTLTHASDKPSADNKQTDTQWQEAFSGVTVDVSSDSAQQFHGHSTEIKSEHDNSACTMDDFPSFDLGF
ncbi:uncharacterized protein LOC132030657 isoform X2 [Lycium ferocissimum]|uniref:uncharacterized protein LOC132030657 isoform X2 n=1 Tax=Lycium ferocissimum TaxID=112874 RepID=UPI0028169564|nr:uncharacterized protein LOC132030657 isoform X2 [Lycium ferocissimum]